MKTQLKLLTFALATFNLMQASEVPVLDLDGAMRSASQNAQQSGRELDIDLGVGRSSSPVNEVNEYAPVVAKHSGYFGGLLSNISNGISSV